MYSENKSRLIAIPTYYKPFDKNPLHNQNFSLLQIMMNQGTLQDSKNH